MHKEKCQLRLPLDALHYQAAHEEEMKAAVKELTAKVEAADKKREQIEQQNKLLHEQLEKLAKQLPNEGKRSKLALFLMSDISLKSIPYAALSHE